jgi:hypothetical protein
MALDDTLIGEICHIRGTRPGSARHDPQQSDADRHAYHNLILMCPTHHTVIDADEEAYTVERLHKIKAEQEARPTSISEADATKVAQVFVQAVSNTGQSGGLSAHTVNASNITVQSAPSTIHLTQRQIQAIEHLWLVTGKLNSEFSLVVFVDTILTRQELDAYFRNGHFGNGEHLADCVREFADRNAPLRKLANSGANDASRERPFVSQRLWSVFFVLQAMYGRSALLIANSYKERRLVDWREDSGCEQLLRAILPEKAIAHAKELEIGGLRTSIDYLESQFLAEASMNKTQS